VAIKLSVMNRQFLCVNWQCVCFCIKSAAFAAFCPVRSVFVC